MDVGPVFSVQSAQHEAAHAVIGFRHGIDIRFGITLDPMVVGCWESRKGVTYVGCSPDYSSPDGPPCAAGTCSRFGGSAACQARHQHPYPAIQALYVGRVPTMFEICCHRETDPDLARKLAEGAICSALAADCLMKHFGHTGDLGTQSDEEYARRFAQAVLPKDQAREWVEALRAQTSHQVSEPRNLALVEEIVRVLEVAPHHTLGLDQLTSILAGG